MAEAQNTPRAFIWKRLHSLTGLFLTLYIIEHLLVNSQAALLVGNNGRGFINAVNHIHDLPYLPFIELFLLGIPILIHMYWGIVYLRTSQQNYYNGEGNKPHFSNQPRNRAYTWQRITSWILLVGIIAHVVHMRFIEYPSSASLGDTKNYMIRLNRDPGLYTLAARMDFDIYDRKKIAEIKAEMQKPMENATLGKQTTNHHSEKVKKQKWEQEEKWLKTLELPLLKPEQIVAVTKSFGLAELLMIRDTFKNPFMQALYTLLVLSACFHGFNGLWTFMISWGVTLTEKSQRIMHKIATGLMILVGFWGLSAIWMTYWINLKQ
jgi:succinate dehydrogenase / fumarate reductase, cytochrome b subunit